MSRVDEALRRASEQPSPAADALPDEPFPIEMREHRRERKGALPDHTAQPADAPVSQLATTEQRPKSSSLLERMSGSLAEKLVIDTSMASSSREQYRRLGAVLHHMQQLTGLTVVMVTSGVPGEGKTLTCTNLALTFSESYGRRVLLIDADLRRPTIHSMFNIDNSSGLSDGLSAVQERKMLVRQVSEKLGVLPAGRPTSDPMASLISDRMRRLIEEARAEFDWVIIDTPPVALLPDAHILAAMSDGALLVVKAESTPYAVVKRAADAIGQERTLGVVLNRADEHAHSTGYYGYYNKNYYYGSSKAEPAARP
jgi:capsular exopolysaccharide synthesis family protein